MKRAWEMVLGPHYLTDFSYDSVFFLFHFTNSFILEKEHISDHTCSQAKY